MRDSYQIVTTAYTLSFRPFYPHRTKIKGYGLALLFFGSLSVYSYQPVKESLLAISLAFFIVTAGYFLREVLFYIPMQYTFDQAANAVYQKSLFVSKRSIMRLDEVVLFKSAERGSWQYKIGKKKSQFVKNYAISTYFTDKSNDKKRAVYQQEIGSKIEQMITKSAAKISTTSSSTTYTP